MASLRCLIKPVGDSHLDQRLPGHAASLGFDVQAPHHLIGEVYVDPPIGQPGSRAVDQSMWASMSSPSSRLGGAITVMAFRISSLYIGVSTQDPNLE